MTRQFAAAKAFFDLPVDRKMEIMVDKYHRCECIDAAMLKQPLDTTTPDAGHTVCPVQAACRDS